MSPLFPSPTISTPGGDLADVLDRLAEGSNPREAERLIEGKLKLVGGHEIGRRADDRPPVRRNLSLDTK